MSSNPDLPNIAWKELQVGRLLGQGKFGEVYLGTWQGRQVAVKKLLLQNLPASMVKDFENETKIMAECSSCCADSEALCHLHGKRPLRHGDGVCPKRITL